MCVLHLIHMVIQFIHIVVGKPAEGLLNKVEGKLAFTFSCIMISETILVYRVLLMIKEKNTYYIFAILIISFTNF
jgi:hypothetical protein